MKADTLALLLAVVGLALSWPLWLVLTLLVLAFLLSFGVGERRP